MVPQNCGFEKAPKNKKNRIGKPFSAYPCGFLHVHKNKRMTGIEPALFWPLCLYSCVGIRSQRGNFVETQSQSTFRHFPDVKPEKPP